MADARSEAEAALSAAHDILDQALEDGSLSRLAWDEPVARTLSVAERIRALVGQHAAEMREPHGNEVALALEVQTLRADRDRLRALLAAYGRAVEEEGKQWNGTDEAAYLKAAAAADTAMEAIQAEAAKWREWR